MLAVPVAVIFITTALAVSMTSNDALLLLVSTKRNCSKSFLLRYLPHHMAMLEAKIAERSGIVKIDIGSRRATGKPIWARTEAR